MQAQGRLFKRQAITGRPQFRFRLAQFSAQGANICRVWSRFEACQRGACSIEPRLSGSPGLGGHAPAHFAQSCLGARQFRLGALNVG
jgi:hypothetical protein